MLNKFGQTDRDRLTAGVFERARAAGVGYLDDAAPDYPSARRSTPSSEYSTEGMPSARGALTGRAEDLVHGFENSLQVRPVAQREQRLRLAPSPRVATLIAVFMLVCGLLVVGWQVLAAPPAAPPAGVLSGDATGKPDSKTGSSAGPGAALAAVERKSGTAGVRKDGGASSPGAAPHLYLPGANGAEVVVHVAGAVSRPGVVHLADPSRVADALEVAGGALPEGDLSTLNLARPLTDGEMIYVPRPGETPPPSVGGNANSAPDGGTKSAGGAGDKVNLNTADLGTLQTLSGIGPALAQRILDYRESNGRFASVDQLDEVSGIGPALMSRLRDHVCV
ncbi:ComEA family DNA-binding protein [Mobiluncus curtisii]|nr:ComEA family DNA-binding protein [Mobiluncus curtisii]STY77570.1 ComE operon protein 1 [Mobiluncus curtisii subsp. curtisii]